jgi:hypothetical protein
MKLEDIIRDKEMPARQRRDAYAKWLFESYEKLEERYRYDPLTNTLMTHYFEVILRAMREGVFLDEYYPGRELGPFEEPVRDTSAQMRIEDFDDDEHHSSCLHFGGGMGNLEGLVKMKLKDPEED